MTLYANLLLLLNYYVYVWYGGRTMCLVLRLFEVISSESEGSVEICSAWDGWQMFVSILHNLLMSYQHG